MSKLHIYKLGNKIADGDGTLSKTEDFTVGITSGSVKKGETYEIKQGQKPSGDSYNCLTGAEKNSDAKFHISTSDDSE